MSVSIVAAIKTLEIFLQSRSEIQLLRRDLEAERQKHEMRTAEIKAMEERRAAEIKAMEERRAADLQGERALRASEVSLARAEAVKEILLLGGTEYYAQILKQLLVKQLNGDGINKDESDKTVQYL